MDVKSYQKNSTKRVLVVDDEPHILRLMKLFLERAGYQVTYGLNGKRALDQIHNKAPDVVIADIEMPIMGGVELSEHLIQYFSELQILIILMTTRINVDIDLWARHYPNIELMEKPLSMRRLVSRLNNYFAESR